MRSFEIRKWLLENRERFLKSGNGYLTSGERLPEIGEWLFEIMWNPFFKKNVIMYNRARIMENPVTIL